MLPLVGAEGYGETELVGCGSDTPKRGQRRGWLFMLQASFANRRWSEGLPEPVQVIGGRSGGQSFDAGENFRECRKVFKHIW